MERKILEIKLKFKISLYKHPNKEKLSILSGYVNVEINQKLLFSKQMAEFMFPLKSKH